MKNLYTTLFLISFGIITNLPAQTLKNIHRHNQPVLRIPTHLIDKVETAEVQGTPHLRVIQFNGYVSEIPLAQIDSITHSEGEAVDPAQLGNLRTASVMGVVSGPTGAPEMNAIVRSPYGGEETRTDPNGVFFLNNILVYDKLGYITITKPGFHQGSRSFLPLETGSNRVNVQLLHMTQSGTFSASSGGTVTSGLLQLNFPANAITLYGQPYTGTVRVFAAALDPTSTSMFDQMPGELLGGQNDSLRLLRSFGMASVELRDPNMNELQLATGVSATLRFNIPTAMQAEAPATIDWWSFNETQGIWMHEGVAQRQGNQYTGQASHFSWWNCDIPQNFNDLHGSVNTSDGTPVSDAQVNVVTPSMGTGITYTNAEGVFSGRVPKNQLLTLNIYLTCETTNDWNLVYTEDFSSVAEPIIGQYEPASLNDRYPITGTVVNCEGQPVQSGYVKLGQQIFITNMGQFVIATCAIGEFYLHGFDSSNPDSIKHSNVYSGFVGEDGINVEDIEACTQFLATVTDIDGNIYPSILIGNQLWMAQNLKTTRFVDGSEISNVTNNTLWTQLTTPAWCNYGNIAANDLTYGKLYNWYTVSDSSGLCPVGWHVPTDIEWTILTDFLGGINVAGGKMKAITGWISPNVGASNLSGFTGLPGGIRNGLGFQSVQATGYWWSSTANSSNSAWYRYLSYGIASSTRSNSNYFIGCSVRCIKD